ncbi:MAG: hypothetical protein E7386_04735 [Ruminococcaceae bacterium]|nr:hypothetical protein [Oscillospiraceae bacterium]
MFRSRVTICMMLVMTLLIAGCSNKAAVESTSETSSSVSELVILAGDTYVDSSTQSFYVMRVKDKYYKFLYTGSSATLLSADDPSLFPALKDGQFARVNADIEETVSYFGVIPNYNVISTKITRLRSSDRMDFEDITKYFNLPSADAKETNKESKLFQYTRNGKLYLILVYKGQVTAYTKKGLFTEYKLEKGPGETFTEFFKALDAA